VAAFPTVKYEWRDLSETTEPVVARAPMERGVPKQRRINSDAQVQFEITIHFDTKAEAAAFETWFFVTIKAGQDWFDFTHPRLGTTVVARVVGGKLGPLTFTRRTLESSKRSLQIEYWRSAW
jgi:hypothetical protein